MKINILLITSIILFSYCSNSPKKATNGNSTAVTEPTEQAITLLKSVSPSYKESFKVGEVISITYDGVSEIDSIQYFVDGQKIKNKDYSTTRVGKINYKVVAFRNGQEHALNGQFVVMAATAPRMQKVKIVRQYPHDPRAYTQGLLFHAGKLYESTGEKGRSSVREVEIATGKVLRKKDLGNQYFGEGLALVEDKLYQLTWTQGVAFVYDLGDFEKSKELPLSGEGWGITTDGKYIYVTDGSSKITKYDPVSFKKISQIEVADNARLVTDLNELEWIDGKIWANIYTTNVIAVINPESGVVERYIDCALLESKIGNYGNADVLNGIAYDPATKRIWMTGKDWDTLFEVSVQ